MSQADTASEQLSTIMPPFQFAKVWPEKGLALLRLTEEEITRAGEIVIDRSAHAFDSTGGNGRELWPRAKKNCFLLAFPPLIPGQKNLPIPCFHFAEKSSFFIWPDSEGFRRNSVNDRREYYLYVQ